MKILIRPSVRPSGWRCGISVFHNVWSPLRGSPTSKTTDHRPQTTHTSRPTAWPADPRHPPCMQSQGPSDSTSMHDSSDPSTPRTSQNEHHRKAQRLLSISVTWVLCRCNAFEAGWLAGWLAVGQGQVGNRAFSNRIATRQSWTRHASADAGPGGELAAWLVNRGPAGQWAAGCHRAGVGRGVGELAVWQRAARPYTVHICATTRGRIPEQTQHGTQAAEKSGARVEALRSARKWRSRNLTAAGQGGLAVWCNLQMPCWVWTLLMTSSWPGL